jgi:hypothetical protein
LPAKIGLKYAAGARDRLPMQVEVCLGIWASDNAAWNLAAANRAQSEVIRRLGVRCTVCPCRSLWREVELLATVEESDEEGWGRVQKAERWLWEHRFDFGLVGVEA